MYSQRKETRPGDIELGDFRRICQEVIDAITDYLADFSGCGVSPEVTPEEVRAMFPEELLQEGESAGALVTHWRERVVPMLMAIRSLRGLFSKNLRLAGHLHNLVREHPDFEVLHEPTLYLYCFRYVPNALGDRQEEPGVQTRLDTLNQEIVEAIQRGGFELVTMTRFRSRVAIRMSICSHRRSEEDVDAAFEAIARWGRLLSRSSYAYNKELTESEELPCSNESYSLPTGVSAT